MDVRVENMQPKQVRQHPPQAHPHLPKHEFSMIIIAPKGSGKTNLIVNLLMKHYKGYFHKILVCSPTIDNDEKWDLVKDTKHVLKENKKLKKILLNEEEEGGLPQLVHDSMLEQVKKADKKERFSGRIPEDCFFPDMQEIPGRIAEQQEMIESLRDMGYGQNSKYLADRLLVIMDDQAGMFKAGNSQNPIVNYVIKHRHSSSSVIVVTQAYKAINKTIRTNCNCIVCFDIPSIAELKAIYEEYPEGMTYDEWVKVYKHCTKEDFGFMYINTKFPKGERLFKNFSTLLKLKIKSDIQAKDDAVIKDHNDSGEEGATSMQGSSKASPNKP